MNYLTKTLTSGEEHFPLIFLIRAIEETPQNNIGYHYCSWLPPRNWTLDHSLEENQTTNTYNRCHPEAERYWGRGFFNLRFYCFFENVIYQCFVFWSYSPPFLPLTLLRSISIPSQLCAPHIHIEYNLWCLCNHEVIPSSIAHATCQGHARDS